MKPLFLVPVVGLLLAVHAAVALAAPASQPSPQAAAKAVQASVRLEFSVEVFDPASPGQGVMRCVVQNRSAQPLLVPVGYDTGYSDRGRIRAQAGGPTGLTLYRLRKGENEGKLVPVEPGKEQIVVELLLADVLLHTGRPDGLWQWDWLRNLEPPRSPIHQFRRPGFVDHASFSISVEIEGTTLNSEPVTLKVKAADGAADAPATAPATQRAPSAQPVPFDTHDGYFVSNQFEPSAPASFVVLADQQAFDRVFGVARVMGDQSHRLPDHALDSKLVVAVIKRGKTLWQFKVQSVTAEAGILTLRYTATATKQDSAEFACPLIVSVPRGDYTAVQFEENGKVIQKEEIGAPTTQPAAAAPFIIKCRKTEDALIVRTEEGKTILSITSPSGIGGATVERTADRWPEVLVLQLHLRGLESLTLTCGDQKLSVSAGPDGGSRRHRWVDGKEGPALTKDSPYWMVIRLLDAAGKTVPTLPQQGGCFEITIPKVMLSEPAKALKLDWIDFYR